jgi:serine/threonine-protein kinase HipA
MKAKLPPALNIRWYDGRLVGRVFSDGPTYFAYDQHWLSTGLNLSPLQVPFTTETFRQRQDGFDQLPGFLSDCLPDQWGRRLMRRAFSELDLSPTPMRMLAWIGSRAVGALSFEPSLSNDSPKGTWADVTPLMLAREAQAVIRDEPSAAFRHLQAAGSPGGALPKATVAWLSDGTFLVGGNVAVVARSHPNARLGILKLDVTADSDRITDGRIEHAYMRMAQAAGIRAAATDVVPVGKRHHLFVERFDCDIRIPLRRHLVTLTGVLHRQPDDYRDLLLTTQQLTRNHQEVLEAARRMIFNVRSGNADDHGKNHSFMLDESANNWTLSPAYDLTWNFAEGREYGGLFPSTFGHSPRRDALLQACMDIGISVAEFKRLDTEVQQALGRWREFAAFAKLPEPLTAAVATSHQAIAQSLEMSSPAKRPKRW